MSSKAILNNVSILFSSSNDPLVTISHGDSLHTANVAARKCFRDSKGNIFPSSQNVRHKLGLLLWRSEIKNGRKGNDPAIQKAVDESSRTKSRKFSVYNELQGQVSGHRYQHSTSTYFVEVVISLRLYHPTHQGKPFEVLAWSQPHSQKVYLAEASSMTQSSKGSFRQHLNLSTTSCDILLPLSSHLNASG